MSSTPLASGFSRAVSGTGETPDFVSRLSSFFAAEDIRGQCRSLLRQGGRILAMVLLVSLGISGGEAEARGRAKKASIRKSVVVSKVAGKKVKLTSRALRKDLARLSMNLLQQVGNETFRIIAQKVGVDIPKPAGVKKPAKIITKAPAAARGQTISNPIAGGTERYDAAGAGWFGATRGGSGEREHKGIDILSTAGGDVYSPIDGEIVGRGYPYEGSQGKLHIVRVKGTGRHAGLTARLYYVDDSGPAAGSAVLAGKTVVGKAEDIATYHGSTAMKNHVHLEVRKGGVLVDPSSLIPGFKTRKPKEQVVVASARGVPAKAAP